MNLTERVTEPIQHLDEDWDVACDYSLPDRKGRVFPWEHGPAKWILFVRCEECSKSGHRLTCTNCKDVLTTTEDAVQCMYCNAVVVPARRAIAKIQALK